MMKEWFAVIILLLSLTFISVIGAHFEIVDQRAELAGNIDRLHTEVISGNAVSPIQYRIGSYLLAEYTRGWFGDDLMRTYQFQRFSFTFLSSLLIFAFFRKFLSTGWAFGGIFLFYAMLPWAYIGYHHQPADPVNLFFYSLAFFVLASEKPWWMMLIVPIGMFNRETVVLLPVLDFIINRGRQKPGSIILRCALTVIAGVAVYAAIYLHFGPREHPDPILMLFQNLKDPLLLMSTSAFLLPLIVIPLAGWKHLDATNRRYFSFSILFIIFYFIFGLFHEMRLFIPILPLLILCTLHAIQGTQSNLK